MCDIDEKTGAFTNQARWSNPKVLIVKQKITSAADFNNVFKDLFEKDIKEVVVFCDEIEATVIPDLIQTRAVRGFKTLVVKMPTLWKDQWYEDLAAASGAVVIDPNAGVTLKNMTVAHLGTFGNIVVSKEDTFIDGIRDLAEHIATFEGEDAELRTARLNTKTARYFVGAESESALSYRRLKVEDAISAAWQALNGGVVPGGGSALVVASDSLPDTVGGAILKKALAYPAKQIAANAGFPDMVIGTDYRDGLGFDTRTCTHVNMFAANIINPARVELNACKNAISVAASVLTAPTVVTFPEQNETVR
jgi:chaperonin GroEL